jgi:hypothetical protein
LKRSVGQLRFDLWPLPKKEVEIEIGFLCIATMYACTSSTASGFEVNLIRGLSSQVGEPEKLLFGFSTQKNLK